jgi:putative hydrolase of the HAD superfamily
MAIPQVKTLILDLGGVLFDIDYHRTQEAFRSIGFTDVEKQYSQLQQTTIFDDLETGKTTPEEFCNQLRSATGIEATNDAIFDAWNAMLLQIPQQSIDFVKSLKGQYDLYLLSNTNEIHLGAIMNHFPSYQGLEELFDRVYYSCRIGMRKPNADIFEYVLSDIGVKAEEAIFIDDSPQHVEGAKSVGIHAFHLKVGEQKVWDLFFS